jgi:hypothetical protein
VLYRPSFYVHVGLLHASLVTRVAGDLVGLHGLRQWGGLLNEAAVVVFVGNMVWTASRKSAEGMLSQMRGAPSREGPQATESKTPLV